MLKKILFNIENLLISKFDDMLIVGGYLDSRDLRITIENTPPLIVLTVSDSLNGSIIRNELVEFDSFELIEQYISRAKEETEISRERKLHFTHKFILHEFY